LNKNEPSDEKKKPRCPCLIYDEDHYTKECPHCAEVSKFIKGSPSSAVLKDPFPPQDRKMVSHNQSSSSTSVDIMLMSSKFMVATRSKDYASKSPVEDGDDSSPASQASTSTPQSFEPLHIEKPNLDMIIFCLLMVCFESQPLTLKLGLLRTITLLKIWLCHLRQWRLLKCCRLVQHKGSYYYQQLEQYMLMPPI